MKKLFISFIVISLLMNVSCSDPNEDALQKIDKNSKLLNVEGEDRGGSMDGDPPP